MKPDDLRDLPLRTLRLAGRKALASTSTGSGPSLRAPGPGARSDDGLDVPLLLPDDVVRWLARLHLLYGVPFEYLVADTALLPPETLRFFFVDENWLRRAVDGALSVGVASTRDNVFNQAFYRQVYEAVSRAIPSVRPEIRGSPPPETPIVEATVSGLLFRSSVVSGYPGLEVVASRADADGAPRPVALLRMDRLAPDILLVLFERTPDRVEFRQPAEGIHFGITRSPGQPNEFRRHLRWLGHTDLPADQAGNQLPNEPVADGLPMRTGTGQPVGVLDIEGTVAGLVRAMKGTDDASNCLGPGNVFTSAEFAVEMVLSAGLQPFALHPPTPSVAGR